MIVLLIILGLVVAVLFDMLCAFLLSILAPYTGVAGIENLDFWNWFFIVLVTNILLLPTYIKSD